MGKKGAKRKTRWRTLSIGAPPSEEDEEEESAGHGFEANGKTGYKPRRQGTGTSGTSGYSSTGGSRSRRSESAGTPPQRKIIFNEDEYMKVVTPGQDLLFKKGYLSRKKPWVSNASNSATPSTTESQSASHSTADGSETTEYQQLLDSGNGEYPPVAEPNTQVGYGTFYDHNSGYYYEYPVMLVGPNVLTTMPCGPVPLRPIEWVNPAFAPKLSNQPYCVMDYQSGQSTEYVPVMDEQPGAVPPVENTNGTWNENGTGSASCNGSVVAEENEEQQPEETNGEQSQTVEENGVDPAVTGPFVETPMVQQAIPVPHMVQPVPQQYMYPGHYMFGPSLVHVNGVTVQCAPMIRTSELPGAVVAFPRRQKKRKQRKQRKLAMANKTNGEEEEDCSSECDDELSSSRLPWSACPDSAATATTTTTAKRPLNPECQEFQLRSVSEDRVSSAPTTSDETPVSRTDSINDQPNSEALDPPETDSTSTETLEISAPIDIEVKKEEARIAEDPQVESIQVEEPKLDCGKPEDIELEVRSVEKVDKPLPKVKKEIGNSKKEIGNSKKEIGNSKKEIANSKKEIANSKKEIGNSKKENGNSKKEIGNSKKEIGNSKKEIGNSKKEIGNSKKEIGNSKKEIGNSKKEIANSKKEIGNSKKEISNSKKKKEEEVPSETVSETSVDAVEQKTEGSNEDSGFESQTQTSLYPITEAVTDWLRRVNSPDIFITSNNEASEEEEEEEEKGESDAEPPKNLQGNPMPALSANSGADDAILSRTASCGEFTRVNNIVSEQTEGAAGQRRKRGEKKSGRRKTSERKARRVPSADFRTGQEEERTKPERNDPSRNNVGDVCEFTEEDSVAGMRVALSSRMDSMRVNSRRTRRRSERSSTDLADNVDLKIRRPAEDDNDEGIVEDTVTVRTFEKGEIVVSIDGKLLPVTSYELFLRGNSSDRTRVRNSSESTVEEISQSRRSDEKKGGNSVGDEENNSMLASLESIEEPDVLDCWETETIEPVVTPKKMLQKHGIVYEGEAAEEDAVLEANAVNLERVKKYYRLARETGEIDGTTDTRKTRTVPNTPDRMADSYCSEELPVFLEDEKSREARELEKIPVDEAFEVYESCYTGKTQFMPLDPGFLKSRPLYGQEGEGPIPCKAVCCNVQ